MSLMVGFGLDSFIDLKTNRCEEREGLCSLVHILVISHTGLQCVPLSCGPVALTW